MPVDVSWPGHARAQSLAWNSVLACSGLANNTVPVDVSITAPMGSGTSAPADVSLSGSGSGAFEVISGSGGRAFEVATCIANAAGSGGSAFEKAHVLLP